MVNMPGGYWCVDGDCGNGTHVHRRELAGSGSCDSAASSSLWCTHCPGGVCHESAVRGHRYWQAGQDCAENEDACDCEMMMPASAFSICVWALVMASVLAPTGFGIVLKIKMAKQAEDEASSGSKSKSLRHLRRSISINMGAVSTMDLSPRLSPRREPTSSGLQKMPSLDLSGGDDGDGDGNSGTLLLPAPSGRAQPASKGSSDPHVTACLADWSA